MIYVRSYMEDRVCETDFGCLFYLELQHRPSNVGVEE